MGQGRRGRIPPRADIARSLPSCLLIIYADFLISAKTASKKSAITQYTRLLANEIRACAILMLILNTRS